jgi:hypothetical protein
MAKIIQSPLPAFPGWVAVSDPLSLAQVIAFQGSLAAVQGAEQDTFTAARALLPGVSACVEYWHIAGIPQYPTPETFPALAAPLMTFLVLHITQLLSGATPDELQPSPDNSIGS